MKLTINSFQNQAKAATNELERHLSSSSKAMERLSSGKRVNTAADDSAALSIASRIESSSRALAKASQNAKDFSNLLGVADGALYAASDQLQRLRELAVTAANETYNDNDRRALEAEATSLIEGLNGTLAATSWGGLQLFDGAFSDKKAFVGDTSKHSNQISVTLTGIDELTRFLSGTNTKGEISAIFSGVDAQNSQDAVLTGTASKHPSALAIGNGNVRITWTTVPSGGGAGSLFVQDFSSDGSPISERISFDDDGELGSPYMYQLTDGATALVYTKYRAGRYTSELLILDQDLNLLKQNTINPPNTGKDYIDNRLTLLSDGGFIHTWSLSDNHPQIPVKGSFAQRFDSSLNKIGNVFQITETVSKVQYMDIVQLDDSRIGSLVLDRSNPGFNLSYQTYEIGQGTQLSNIQLASAADSIPAFPKLAEIDSRIFASWIQPPNGDLYIAELDKDGSQVLNNTLLASGVRRIPDMEIARKEDGSELLIVSADYIEDADGVTVFSVDSNLSFDSETYAIDREIFYGGLSGSRLNILSRGEISFGAPPLSPLAIHSQNVNIEAASTIDPFSLQSSASSRQSIESADRTLEIINAERGMIGAIQNRLSTIISLHQNSIVNLEQSKSLLVDADFARETSELARAQVLQTSASAMISQANGLANEIIEVVNSATGRS